MANNFFTIFFLLALGYSLRIHTCVVSCQEGLICISNRCVHPHNNGVIHFGSDLPEMASGKELNSTKKTLNQLSEEIFSLRLAQANSNNSNKNQSQKIQNLLQKKYISYIGGPILFTAPHSKYLNRGGPKYGQELSVHQRQVYIIWLAAKLAMFTSLSQNKPNSFIAWGNNSFIDEKDLDPNYLLQQMFPQSPFHQSLHYWAIKNSELPILHVDVHGKLNRQKNCQIDVGIRSMQVHWENDSLIKFFKPFFQQDLSKIFEGLKFRNFTCIFNTSPLLDGYWRGSKMTLTEQAIKLNIPSFQLQIPVEVRMALFQKPDLMAKFAEGIKQFYLKIIIPYFETNKRQLKVSKQISDKFEPTIKTLQQFEQAQKQIQEMEEKYKQNFEGNLF